MISKCCNAEIVKDYLGNKRCTMCLLPAKPKLSFRLLYIFIFFSIVFLGFSMKEASHFHKSYYTTNIAPIDTCDIELTDSCILKELMKDSCILPNISLAQAKIESNYYKSEKTFKCKNIFGIKLHPCKYVKGEYNYQAVYSSYKDNIACYCEIQKSYLKSIDGHYAQNTGYVSLIKQIK